MSFLKKILKSTNHTEQPQKQAGGFATLSQEEIDAHLGINRYGDFLLTDAVRPSYELDVVPKAGYRWDQYDDKSSGVRIPVLIASASKPDLFDLFLDLVRPLGDEVDLVLETSHSSMGDEHRDRHREHIELPILMSTLYDYEEMLTNDGCAGIALLNPRKPMEVQLDEHKLLVMYGRDLERMEAILMNHGLERDDDMKFITEAEHVHSSTEEFQEQFENLCYSLALDDR
jgi:hypothetical protein